MLEPRFQLGDGGIYVGAGLLDRVGEIAAQTGDSFSRRSAIITNATVARWYAARVAASLAQDNFDAAIIEMPDGEAFKTLDTVRDLYDQLIEAKLDRGSPIFALGGGVVGDVAGFVAATFLRGIPFFQIPTTLLAMVDASIGGKVGVDHPRGKNLIGAFKMPRAVIADVDALKTLPESEVRCGMAEVVKHAVIGDGNLFRDLETERLEIGDWIADAMQVKVDIVARDPLEQGERVKLNLGHTFAHALEAVSHYQLRHGQAVAIGLVCAARLAVRLELGDAALAVRIEALLARIGLPTRIPHEFSAAEILAAMATDKKRMDGGLRFVLPRAVGDVVIEEIATPEVMRTIEESRDER